MCVCLKEMRAMPVCDYTVKGGNTLDLETCLTAAVPRRDHGGTAGRQRSGCPLGLAIAPEVLYRLLGERAICRAERSLP